MAEIDLDFEGANKQDSNLDNTDDSKNNVVSQEDTTNLNGNDVEDVTAKDNTKTNNDNNNSPVDKDDTIPHDIEVGTNIEFDGVSYTVDEKGNLIDKAGNVFLEAKDVKQWLDSNTVEDDNNNDTDAITIDNLKQTLGIDITDENGNPVTFENTPKGIKEYIDSVIEVQTDEIKNATLNDYFAKYPYVQDFVNYVQLNGTPKGFGETISVQGVQLDKDNESQLENVIRHAAKTFGNKSLNENYIKYLKSTGSLYDEAKAQLEALVELEQRQAQERAQIMKAREEEDRRIQEERNNKLFNVINSKTIAGYKLPDNVIREVNGKKVTASLQDFYDYVTKPVRQPDGSLSTQYIADYWNQDDTILTNNQLMEAWLLFTKGSYKDLINMVAKEDNVKRLVIKSKENKNRHTIKVSKPTAKVDMNDILL